MSAPAPSTPPRQTASSAAAPGWRKVWDAPTRLFHWLLVLLLASAYATAKSGWIDAHFLVGYSILALVLFRVAWGLIGSETARFANFVRPPGAALAHLAHVLRREREDTVGHNPAGAYMILVLLGLLALQTGTGLFSTDGIMVDGPLAGWVSAQTAERITAWHAFNFDLIAIAVAIHVLAVIVYAVVLREDLVRPMVTGWKKLPADAAGAPHLVSAVRALLTFLVAASAVWALVALA